MRIGYLFIFLVIIIIWYIGMICYNGLIKNELSDRAILIFSTLIYFSMMAGYTYYHFDEFYEHACQINKESLLLLIITAFLMFISNMILWKLLF